nr:stomatal closure-related actin-binding protein 2-like [Tanacetum cinerariifolium]
MTNVSPEVVDELQMQAVISVSTDVSFTSNKLPKYKLGPDNHILDEATVDSKGPPLKEVVAQETGHLSEQHKRLSVRDVATKFDKNWSAAAKLSNEAKLREMASLEGHVLLKKLRDALEYLRGRSAERAQCLARAVLGEALPIEQLETYCPENGMILANCSAIGTSSSLNTCFQV